MAAIAVHCAAPLPGAHQVLTAASLPLLQVLGTTLLTEVTYFGDFSKDYPHFFTSHGSVFATVELSQLVWPSYF